MASIFALKNIAPATWRDVRNVQHEHEQLTDAQLYAIAAQKAGGDGQTIDVEAVRVGELTQADDRQPGTMGRYAQGVAGAPWSRRPGGVPLWQGCRGWENSAAEACLFGHPPRRHRQLQKVRLGVGAPGWRTSRKVRREEGEARSLC